MPANLDWLYHSLGWILAAAGVALILWGLWDRHSRLRRCPKCWYDMSGTPGMRCPECGREARSERHLHRARRRWWCIAPAIVLVLGGYATWCVPRYQARGWAGFVPSAYLAYFAPVTSAPAAKSVAGAFVNLFATRALPPRIPNDPLAEEFWARLRAGSLVRWESDVYLTRYMRANGIDLRTIVEVPPAWPLGPPVPYRTDRTQIAGLEIDISSRGSPPSDRLKAPTAPRRDVEFEISLRIKDGKKVYRSRHRLPIDLTRPPATFMKQVNTPEATDKVMAEISPHLAMSKGKPVLILHDRPEPGTRGYLPFVLAYRFEVRVGERLLVTGTQAAPWAPGAWLVWAEAQVDWPEEAAELLLSGEATITIRGDLDEATNVFTKWPFDRPEPVYWAGEFSQKLEMRPHPRKR